ncbi:MAG: LysR family transcriptional regulator [Betaproteobacteria bacterium]|nr:LysR family transcriptional regulator [Betaproteobacteria bacterium]
MKARKPPTVLRLRVIFAPDAKLGPGKADLLDGIRETGSISAAGRRMRMSYKRAWKLVDELNGLFRGPLVVASSGGPRGGGACLTALGEEVLARFRRIEAHSARAAASELAALRGLLRRKR